MKPLPWICALSLAANLTLAAYIASRSPAPSPVADTAATDAPTEPGASATNRSAQNTGTFTRADTALAAILDGTDLRAMRDALEATGLTAEDAKAVIRLRIQERQKAARAAIDQRTSPGEATWWYQDDAARETFEKEKRAARSALNDELTQTLASLFGPEPDKPAAAQIHNQTRFLPEAKRLAVTEILRDYEAMERELRAPGQNRADLPSDRERRRYIAEERRKDLAALLTPEELREFDLRHSQTAQNLRWPMASMKPSLNEYQAIYDMRAAIDRDFDNSGSDDRPPDYWQKRQQTEAEGLRQLRATLGEERYIDYALGNDHSAPNMIEAVRRYNLPADTGRELWKIRQDAGREGQAISDDRTLTLDEKRARIAEIGRRSREAIAARLSPEVLDELQNNDYVNWTQHYEKHRLTIYNELGNGTTSFGF